MSRHRIAVEERKVYLVLDEPMDTKPVLRSYFWSLGIDPDRVKEGLATVSRFPGGSVVDVPAAAGIHPFIKVHLDGQAQAARIDEQPIPCPKTRRDRETRYVSGRWEAYSKQRGWEPL